MNPRYFNLAILLTFSRIVLVPVFMVLVLQQVDYGAVWATAVFIIAAITDGLDGYVARSRKEITKFGQLIDPIADKLLISGALVTLVALQQVSAWIAMIVLGREFAVSGLRMLVAAEGVILPASVFGKVKTVSQIIAIVAVLLGIPFAGWLLWIAAAITVLSGLDYFVRAQRYVFSD